MGTIVVEEYFNFGAHERIMHVVIILELKKIRNKACRMIPCAMNI